jgi:branched-chain amino acid transport system ATP-binding protein
MTPLLDVRDLEVGYGPVRAVRGVTFQVHPGETVAVVGANGAGKTTLLRALSNMLGWTGGDVRFGDISTRGRKSYSLTRQGLLHVPEGRGTLQKLTVMENLQLAFELRPSREAFSQALERVIDRFPRLGERLTFAAGNMSGGEQQMLALARAVINKPKLLLIDEPSLGLSPRLVKDAFAVLRGFKAEGIPLVLVEQNARAALSLADTGYVMRQGKFVLGGKASELLSDSAILSHYLGA